MGKRETKVQNIIRLAAAAIRCVLFRINTGRAWTGNKVVRQPDGSIIIYDPRPFDTGVKAGYSDLTGWTPVVVTQEMVGTLIPVFTAVEVKAGKNGATEKQQLFIDAVKAAGGYAGVARSADDLYEIVKKSPDDG